MFDIELIFKFRFEKTSGEIIMVMAATLFKLNSLESETDKEMTTTSKIVVQYSSGPEGKRQKHWRPALGFINNISALYFVKYQWCSGRESALIVIHPCSKPHLCKFFFLVISENLFV